MSHAQDRTTPPREASRTGPRRRWALTAAAVVTLVAPLPVEAAERAHPPSPLADRIVLTPTTAPERSQTFGWRTDATTGTGAVEVVPAGGGATITAPTDGGDERRTGAQGGDEQRVRHHHVTVTGLEPGTAYRYRIGAEGRWTPWRTFTTADADGSRPWRWLAFGDAQNGLDEEWPVHVRRAYDAVPDARLVLHAGDLVNHPTHDVEWGDWFAAQGDVPATRNVLATPGNHEFLYDLGSVDLTGRAYRDHLRFPGNGPAGEELAWYADYQDVRFVSLSTGLGVDLVSLARQGAWLDDVLARNPRRWAVVTFHYPVFSTGIDDGQVRANPQVRAAWLDILERHDVDLVLQGHDHTYGRGYRTANGPVYAVSVLGPKYYDLSPEDDNDWTRNGAVRVAGAGATSTYTAVCMDGDRLVYEAVIAAKGAASTTTRGVGETLDAVTIDRSGGRKRVIEGGTCVGRPGPGGGAEPGGPDAGGISGGPVPDAPATAADRAGGGSEPIAPVGRSGPRRSADLRWAGVRTDAATGALRVTLRASGAGRVLVGARTTTRPVRTAARTVRRRVFRPGTTTVRLRPTAAVLRRLRGGRTVRVRITARHEGAAGGRTTLRRTVTLRPR